MQATLSVVLVAGSTMLGRSLGNLEGQDFGFNRDGRVLVSVGRPSASFTGERLTALYRDLEERLARIPGVQSAGLALYNPLTNNWGEGVLIAGKPPPAPGEQTGASWDRVSANYLQQLGVKLVRGRHFTAADNETAENVAVVNEAFVRRFFKAERGSARSALRAEPARERQLLPHRRRGGRRPVRGLPARPPDAADVLRAARPDGELRQRDDDSGSRPPRTTWAGCCW